MLTGRLPYGLALTRVRHRSDLRRLSYEPARLRDRRIPAWVDGAIQKAAHLDPWKRYQEVSEFAWDLRHPNAEFLQRQAPPLIARNPLAFWKGLSLALSVALLAALTQLARMT